MKESKEDLVQAGLSLPYVRDDKDTSLIIFHPHLACF